MKKQGFNIAAALMFTFIGFGTTQAFDGMAIPEVVSAPEIKTDPYVLLKGDRVLVNYLNLTGATVVVKVVDEQNRLLYFEKFTDTPVVEKAINFTQATKGTYKVEVRVDSGNRTYSESLSVIR